MKKIKERADFDKMPVHRQVKRTLGKAAQDPELLKKAIFEEKNKKCQPCFKS